MIGKPWGYEELIFAGEYVMKRLHIDHGKRTSLHLHERKTETMYFMAPAWVIVGNQEMRIAEGGTVQIAPGVPHRIEARYFDLDVIEASSPELDDVVRIEDDYARLTSV